MQIFMNGNGKKDYAPDQILASVTFDYHADTYDAALKGGVETVKNYINLIAEATDFTPDDFKTRAYYIHERTHYNELAPEKIDDLDKNLRRLVSDGFFFSQYAYLQFDYDKERLAKLLVISSKIPNAPKLNINFELKDTEAKKRELIAVAYEDAKKKAEALASAAGKNLRDCVRVEIDTPSHSAGGDFMYDAAPRMSKSLAAADYESEIQNIDETFKPDDITVSKSISCIWETSN